MITVKLDDLIDLLVRDWDTVPGSEQDGVARDIERRKILDNLDRYHNTITVKVEL